MRFMQTRRSPMYSLPLYVVIVMLLVSGASLRASAAEASAAEDSAQFEQFLTRLGLLDLQAAFLEERLDGNLPQSEQEKTAKRLADLYAGQLVTYSADRDKYDRALQNIERLIARFPAAKTPSLDVMLLQADYYRAEQLMNRWLTDHTQAAAREEAQKILTRIAPQLAESFGELKKTTEQLLTQLESLEAGDERDSIEQRLSRLESVAGRAGYFAGWANYYAAVAKPAATTADFARAVALFRELLALPDEYSDTEADMIGLESIWRSRAAIGLGLAEAGAGNLEAASLCFDWLDTPNAPPEIRDQAPYWRLQALLNAGHFDAAKQLAENQVANLSGNASAGKVSFCVSLVRSAFGQDEPTDAQRDMGMLGITGLIKLRQNGVVRQLMEQYKIQVDASAGFYMQWIKGQQVFEQAEVKKDTELYQSAAGVLEQALQSPDVRSDLGAAGQCRSQLAWCYYRLERFEDAARAFEKASAERKAAKDAGSVESAWMAFVAYQRLAKDQPRFVPAALNVLGQIQRDFPQHEYAKRAAYHIGKLRSAAATKEETLATLQSVPPDSANYLAARFDICNLLYEKWKEADDSEKPTAASQLAAAVDQYLQAARGATDSDERARSVKVCLLAAGAGLDEAAPNPALATKYLQLAERLANELPPANPVAAEFHFRAYQQARATSDQAAVERHARWLAEHGRGTPYELAGLVTAATAIDGELQSAGENATREQLEQALELYGRLAELFGDSPATIAANKNARVAVSKSAEFAQRLGRHAEAATWLESLLEGTTSPDGTQNRDYVRRAGIAWFDAREYDRSLPHWRTLLAGLKKGSPDWFEAKYYQLACLAPSDPDVYRQVRNQFQLLYPTVPAPWDDKFAALP